MTESHSVLSSRPFTACHGTGVMRSFNSWKFNFAKKVTFRYAQFLVFLFWYLQLKIRLCMCLSSMLDNLHHILVMHIHWWCQGVMHPMSPCTAAFGVRLPTPKNLHALLWTSLLIHESSLCPQMAAP